MEAFYASWFPHSDCGTVTHHLPSGLKVHNSKNNIYHSPEVESGFDWHLFDGDYFIMSYRTLDAAIQALKAVAQ